MEIRDHPKLKCGFAALVGRSNVGKSTLANALLNRKVSIISARPQTTRHRILGVRNGPGWQLVLVDTPGFYKPLHAMGRYIQKAARQESSEADLILFVVDGSRPPSDEDRTAARALLDVIPSEGAPPVFLVMNKQDIAEPSEDHEREREYRSLAEFTHVFRISALRRKGIEPLLEAVLAALPEGPQYFPEGMHTDQSDEIQVAELIREKILQFTRQEIPHSVAVQVEHIREGKTPGSLHIYAIIYLEKPSQKKIVIGSGGAMLKKIGSASRPEIEALLGKNVFLELWVKVKEDWRNREDFLRSLGYW
jgi:GTP-binding protein Era